MSPHRQRFSRAVIFSPNLFGDQNAIILGLIIAPQRI
jgi:hypothetical protein